MVLTAMEFTPDPDCTDSREIQYLRSEIIRVTRCKMSTVGYFDKIINSLGRQLELALEAQYKPTLVSTCSCGAIADHKHPCFSKVTHSKIDPGVIRYEDLTFKTDPTGRIDL